MKALCAGVTLAFVVACGADDHGGAVLAIGGTNSMCPAPESSSAGRAASAADDLARAMDLYRRCASRCDQARAQACLELDYNACADYCVGWENRVANGLCVAEIADYISCRETVTDLCSFPSGAVPQACLPSLVKARC